MGGKKVFGRDWSRDVPKPAVQHEMLLSAFQVSMAVISEHGIVHGIIIYWENKSLNIKDKKCLCHKSFDARSRREMIAHASVIGFELTLQCWWHKLP